MTRLIKLESSLRLAELKALDTLKRIGLQEDYVLCDIGAGSGVFTIPAATLTKNKVHALEIDEEMLAIIGEKAKRAGLTNIELIKVQEDNLDVIADQSIDIVLMVTVLHELDHKPAYLAKVKKLLKKQGKIAIIEFHKQETPLGPPPEIRLSKDEVQDLLLDAGFAVQEAFDLGANFYCLIFITGESNETARGDFYGR